MSNFASTTRTTMLALRICSARLDPKLSHEHFAQLVADFREAVEEDAAPLKPFAQPESSTGPAAVVAAAQPDTTETAARETPAGPSTNTTSDGSQSPGAALPSAASPPTMNHRDKDAPGPGSKLKSPAELSLQAKNGRRMTPEQVAQLRTDFDRARESNNGKLPWGWLEAQSKATGFTPQTISGRVHQWMQEPPKPVQPQRIHAEEPAPPEAIVDKVDELRRDAAPRVHANGHGCWCRKGPDNAKNRWCSNANDKPSKHVPGLAGLQEPRPRSERYFRRSAEVDA